MPSPIYFCCLLLLALPLRGSFGLAPEVPSSVTPLPLEGGKSILIQTGENRFLVAIPGVRLLRVEQQEAKWCWAACAQIILAHQDIQVTQRDLVEATARLVRGDVKMEDAMQYEIYLAMNPDLMLELRRRELAWYKPDGATYQVHMAMNMTDLTGVIDDIKEPTDDIIVQELSRGRPVVLGLAGGPWGGGHAVVCFGVEYSRQKTKGTVEYRNMGQVFNRLRTRFDLHRYLILDPWPSRDDAEQVLDAALVKGHVSAKIGQEDSRYRAEKYLKMYYPTPDEMKR